MVVSLHIVVLHKRFNLFLHRFLLLSIIFFFFFFFFWQHSYNRWTCLENSRSRLAFEAGSSLCDVRTNPMSGFCYTIMVRLAPRWLSLRFWLANRLLTPTDFSLLSDVKCKPWKRTGFENAETRVKSEYSYNSEQ